MKQIFIITLFLLMFVIAMLAWQEHHDNMHDNVPRCFSIAQAQAAMQQDLHVPFQPTGAAKAGSLKLMRGCHWLFHVKMGK